MPSPITELCHLLNVILCFPFTFFAFNMVSLLYMQPIRLWCAGNGQGNLGEKKITPDRLGDAIKS